MLTPEEEEETWLQAEAQTCAEVGMRFHRFLVLDRGVRSSPNSIILFRRPARADGATGFHRDPLPAGIGRSTVVAAAFLIRLGLSADEALARISLARGLMFRHRRPARFYLQLEQRENRSSRQISSLNRGKRESKRISLCVPGWMKRSEWRGARCV